MCVDVFFGYSLLLLMAAAEPASASVGPRYAPDDPSLPKPWKGLIDGSTGMLYYWNPETNVTQYEKPAALPPPLPPGPPPAVTPKLAPLPVSHSTQPNEGINQRGPTQMAQATQQHGQQPSSLPQHAAPGVIQNHGPLGAQVSDQQDLQQQSSQFGPAMQQPGQFTHQQIRPPMIQYPGQQMPQHPSQPWSQQPGHQMQQQTFQPGPQQLGQQSVPHQNPQVPQSQQGHQYSHQHLQYVSYPPNVIPQDKQNSQTAQPGPQGPQFPGQKEYNKTPVTKKEDFPLGNQSGWSPSQFHQTSVTASQNHPGGTNAVQMPQTGVHLTPPQQFIGSVNVNVQPPNSMAQPQQTGSDYSHRQHGPSYQNHMGPPILPNEQSTAPSIGTKIGFEGNVHSRSGNDYSFNINREQPVMSPPQPKLSAIPMARNQQVSCESLISF